MWPLFPLKYPMFLPKIKSNLKEEEEKEREEKGGR